MIFRLIILFGKLCLLDVIFGYFMDVLDDNLVVESAVVKGFEDGYGSIIFG
jgi:hypothetical protein